MVYDIRDHSRARWGKTTPIVGRHTSATTPISIYQKISHNPTVEQLTGWWIVAQGSLAIFGDQRSLQYI